MKVRVRSTEMLHAHEIEKEEVIDSVGITEMSHVQGRKNKENLKIR